MQTTRANRATTDGVHELFGVCFRCGHTRIGERSRHRPGLLWELIVNAERLQASVHHRSQRIRKDGGNVRDALYSSTSGQLQLPAKVIAKRSLLGLRLVLRLYLR